MRDPGPIGAGIGTNRLPLAAVVVVYPQGAHSPKGGGDKLKFLFIVA